ncbi:zinc finger CCCH domain-containing protein 48, partial [Tanacetum coccineum]
MLRQDCQYFEHERRRDTYARFTQKVIEGHQKVVSGIALPVGPDKLYTGSKDGTVSFWDFQDRTHNGWNAKGRMQDAQWLLMIEGRK